MEYAEQLVWKREVVRGLLQEIGKFEQPPMLDTVSCDEPWHYRNQMRFSVNREGQPGLTARGTRRVRARESRAYVESSAGSRDAAFPRVPGCPLR